MTEWNIAALVLEKWGLPGLIGLGLAWAVYRFGVRPSPEPPAAQPTASETAAAIARLSDKIDAHHQDAQEQRREVSDALHKLDVRMVRIETRLDVTGK